MFQALRNCLRIVILGEEIRDSRCACCGACCKAFGGHLQASRHDIERWQKEGRDDLLARVSSVGFLWINPETGALEESCPYLERVDTDSAYCGINETKPAICRDYPTLAHGRRCIRAK